MNHSPQTYIRETVTVMEGNEGRRFDEFSFCALESIPSKRSAFKAVKKGYILLDGKVAQPNSVTQVGQIITLLASTKVPTIFPLSLRVIWEDDWLAVIEKPPGFPVNGNFYRTIENALTSNLKRTNVRDALFQPLPVHRLDSPTGGLLLVAKSAYAMVSLGRQFQERSIKKKYRAILEGRLENSGKISNTINGKLAESSYHVVEFTPSLKTNWVTTVDLEMSTGRTHQLRRHMALLGFPIMGDTHYGIPGQIYRGKGLFLWSVELGFRHPVSGDHIIIKIDEPGKFKSFRIRETRRWRKYFPKTVESKE